MITGRRVLAIVGAGALALITACVALSVQEVWLKPFAYADLKYVDSVEEFNAAPQSIKSWFGIGRDQPPVASQWTKRLQSRSLYERIREAAAITRKLQAEGSAKGQEHTSANLFQSGPQFINICSEHAKIFTALMESTGVTARVLWMCGHTTSEIYDPDNGWILVDTFGNLMFRRHGRYLSLLDVINRTDFEAVNIVENDGGKDFVHNGYLKKATSVYRANDCIVTLDPDDLNDFHLRLRDPSAVLGAFLGESSVARGLQFTGGTRAKLGNFGLNLYRRFGRWEKSVWTWRLGLIGPNNARPGTGEIPIR